MTNEAEPLTLVLVGPMAAGKTSVGRRVARRLGVAFIDTDKRIVAAHGPIPEIFATHGEAYFRDLERAAVREALAEGGVISLGGGAVTDPETRALLRAHPVVFLTVSEAAVADRLRGGTRPLLAGEDPVEKWKRIFAERRGWYDEVASATFDTSRRPMQRIADEIVAWRREQR
ncbi:shikimate kinase [Microbacterium paraoxydans]|uniref:shikimate kinase n=1 Tax=Microbacterium paraoxydans TaxID=199592 RepID=UPI0021A38C8C|nr:shikimate kinase [Microbacterium paraoxydans]MCT2222636.1 shikimate kinase [Microbacterium paraoxydans]